MCNKKNGKCTEKVVYRLNGRKVKLNERVFRSNYGEKLENRVTEFLHKIKKGKIVFTQHEYDHKKPFGKNKNYRHEFTVYYKGKEVK